MNHRERIIIALDTPNLKTAEHLLKRLGSQTSIFKVGFELFTAHGWEAVNLVHRYHGKVFLDLKLHDIPNTVAKAAAVLCEHEIHMLTLHALGGRRMMSDARKAVAERAQTGKNPPNLLAVTVLTSHSEEDLARDLGISRPLKEQVLALAGMAVESGVSGIVCSPQEVSFLRKNLPGSYWLITPGIRMPGGERFDQQRTFTPREAFDAGADYIVVGRPVTAAENPAQALEDIISNLK